MSNKFAYDVFLSHNSQDKPAVRKLARRLAAAGLRVWFDDWVIKPGDDIYLAVERGLADSRTLLLCMTPAAFGSDWVGLERSTVLFRDPSNQDRRFIPLLLADCALPDTLRRYKYVDYRAEADDAFAELLAACRSETEPPAPAAPPKPTTKPKPAPQPEPPQPLAVLERKLKGHTDWVNSIAVSPDGTWAASGSEDKTVKLWDLETGECRATLEGHTSDVNSIVFTWDGKRILSASDDKTVCVWDAESGHRLTTCEGHTDEVWSVVALPDGRRALSGSFDQTLRLWDIHSGQCLKTIQGAKEDIFGIAVNATGDQAVSGHRNGELKLWNLETTECLATLSGHTDIVRSVQITPDGRYAVSGSGDKTVKIWDLATGACVGTLEGHQNIIHSVAISPDGALIASTGFTDGTVRLWDWQSGACLQVIETDRKNVDSPFSAVFSLDGLRLVVSTATGIIYVYRLTGVRAAPPAEATRRYVNAKVVLLGESGVGKSGLAHRLIEDKFVSTYSTHGMQVWRLEVPVEPEETLEREALLWDLAGQEDYRLIHQLFLDETALALVLINPQKEDPFAEVGDWLKALRAAVTARNPAREAVKLLIAARVDVGAIKISQQKIDRFLREHGLAAYLETSAKRGDNCSDRQNGGQPSALKQLIAQHLPWASLPWTSTPALLGDIKNAVLDMTEQRDIRLLRFAELAQRLEQALPEQHFGEAEGRTAVTLLANHGLVMPFKFGDLVLLRPEALNGYAAAVIRAARAHVDEIGCVAEQDIFARRLDLEGVDRLAPADEELLLRAMVQTLLDRSLCIAEDTPAGRHLIFPSQYRRERPIPAHPEIFISYTFSGELQTVYTTLVVRLWYSREFDHKELWRNAAEFMTSKGRTVGLLMERSGEGEGTLSLFFETGVPDELKVVFIEYVHRHLEKYAREVRRDRRYVCPACGAPVRDLEVVRKRLAAGKDFVTCQECDEHVPLIDHIEQRLASDPVARRVLGMDETARQQLDTQALEQILIGHMLAICGEANQIFRQVSRPDSGLDGEVEFKDNHGQPSGRKIYVQLKSGDSYLRIRQTDGQEIFEVKNPRHLADWAGQPVDVYLVSRDAEETIRWMNLTRYLKTRQDKQSRQIVFAGEKLDAPAVWRLRDEYIPPAGRVG